MTKRKTPQGSRDGSAAPAPMQSNASGGDTNKDNAVDLYKTKGSIFLPAMMSEFDLLEMFIPLLTDCRDELQKSEPGTPDRFRSALLDEALFNLNVANLPNDEMMARRRKFQNDQHGEDDA